MGVVAAIMFLALLYILAAVAISIAASIPFFILIKLIFPSTRLQLLSLVTPAGALLGLVLLLIFHVGAHLIGLDPYSPHPHFYLFLFVYLGVVASSKFSLSYRRESLTRNFRHWLASGLLALIPVAFLVAIMQWMSTQGRHYGS